MLIDLCVHPLSHLPLNGIGLDSCGIGRAGLRLFRVIRSADPMSGALIDLKTGERTYFGYAYVGCGMREVDICLSKVEFFAVVKEDFTDTLENKCLIQIIEMELAYRARDNVYILPLCKWFPKWHRSKMIERFSKYCHPEIVLAAYKRFDEIF